MNLDNIFLNGAPLKVVIDETQFSQFRRELNKENYKALYHRPKINYKTEKTKASKPKKLEAGDLFLSDIDKQGELGEKFYELKTITQTTIWNKWKKNRRNIKEILKTYINL